MYVCMHVCHGMYECMYVTGGYQVDRMQTDGRGGQESHCFPHVNDDDDGDDDDDDDDDGILPVHRRPSIH